MEKINRIIVLFLVLFSTFVIAQTPSCPTCGTGGTTPGKQSVPIDMYVYILATAAILMIAYFAKKYKTQKI
ncbi:signal peptidase [Chryseobacterium wangxinyae]|uniref:signal peptidase n=1 Tax=Chryseobacterium sp. CY350 TaxID=2997336 RepID=UPI00226EC722|nr:signal peptidase [Chryseobacterium sp. CY350]MCY0979216.1 signal peptidase [Chryseobacterium sp. CY350]WBZ94789.1 signal peptidase [Chryseobacterium sp. CY350]